MSAHTPGPWVDNGNGDVVAFDESGGLKEICSIYATFYDDTDAANARLIAAAPELLEALQSALEWGAPFKDAPRGSRPEWFGMAKQAIAKATGGKACA